MFKKNLNFIILFLFSILLIALAINNYGVWTDEVYTLNMIKHSYLDIVRIENTFDGTPFYFIWLKFFVDLIPKNSLKDTVVIARFFSIIPIILLLFLGNKKITRTYGEYAGILFMVVLFSGNIINYSIELRCYSWNILFSTLAFFEYLDLMNNKNNWFKFILYSSLSFYMHKTSVFPSIILYLSLFVKSINDKKIIKFFKNIFITFLMCFPIVLYTLILNYNDDIYVIGAIHPVFSLSKIKESIIFPVNTGNLYISLFYLLILSVIFIIYLRKKPKKFYIVGVISIPLTILFLMTLAYLSNHDYYPKYMLSSLGIMLTSFALIINEFELKKVIFTVLVFINSFTYINNYLYEYESKVGFEKFENYFSANLNNNEIIIFNFDYGQYIVEYYELEGLKDNKLIWNDKYLASDNSYYFIQTSRLDYFFDDKKYDVIESFNISNDYFSLCRVD